MCERVAKVRKREGKRVRKRVYIYVEDYIEREVYVEDYIEREIYSREV